VAWGRAILDREVYGAILVTDRGQGLLAASAASPAVARLLERTALQPSDGAELWVTDIAPTPPTIPEGPLLGPRGIGAGAGLLMLAGNPSPAHFSGPCRHLGRERKPSCNWTR
jgi:hypothetical protein